MSATFAVAGLAAALGAVGILIVRRRWRTRDRRALERDLEDRLADALPAGTGSHLESPPTIRQLAVVDAVECDADEPIPVYVPVVRIDLETADSPGMKFALEYVADALEAIHPVLRERDARVRHYDVEFTFGPDGLFVAGECRRVSVPPALADRLVDEDRYRAFDLWRDVKRGDRTEGPPVLWDRCTNY